MKGILKNRLGQLFLVFLGSSVLAAGFTLHGIPEVRFWKEAAIRKKSWTEKLRQSEVDSIALCFGGSSTAFGIDADHATQVMDFPMVNLGLHAGMGVDALTGFALSQAQSGDLLVVMLEPDLLITEPTSPALGSQFAFAIGQPEILRWRDGEKSIPVHQALTNLRPGGANVFGVVGNIVLGREPYRYRIEDLSPGGLVATEVRSEIAEGAIVPESLSSFGQQVLTDLARIAESENIQVIYCPPWSFTESDHLESVLHQRRLFLKDVERLIPVLWEPNLGIHSVRKDFADSLRHLTKEAARKRTRALVNTLQEAR